MSILRMQEIFILYWIGVRVENYQKKYNKKDIVFFQYFNNIYIFL